jgi:hypothetical protein
METKTASKIKVFLVKSRESKSEHNNGSSNTLASKAYVKKDLARLDQEAQELVNQIFDMFEDG